MSKENSRITKRKSINLSVFHSVLFINRLLQTSSSQIQYPTWCALYWVILRFILTWYSRFSFVLHMKMWKSMSMMEKLIFIMKFPISNRITRYYTVEWQSIFLCWDFVKRLWASLVWFSRFSICLNSTNSFIKAFIFKLS